MQSVDLLTIGAGGGAYPAAFRLAKAGRSVVMVDPKGVMSGNCLYEGCIPSKAMRETAVMLQTQQRFATRGHYTPPMGNSNAKIPPKSQTAEAYPILPGSANSDTA